MRGIRAQLGASSTSGRQQRPARMLVDNAEWLRSLRTVEFMRDVGKHFTVNYMLQKDSVKARLDGGHLVHRVLLHAAAGVRLPGAASALRRAAAARRQRSVGEHHGGHRAHSPHATAPKRTRSRCRSSRRPPGTKFGKSEAGAVWLDPALTSPYKFYQFWINVDDRDVGRYLRYFTLLSREEIEALDEATEARPGAS